MRFVVDVNRKRAHVHDEAPTINKGDGKKLYRTLSQVSLVLGLIVGFVRLIADCGL